MALIETRSDVSLLSNARTLAITLSRQLSKINLLVLTAGILSFNGRTETSEGHDVKMVLHYYSRMLFIDALLPNLQAAAVGTGGEGNARVMSVLNSMEGDCRKLLWDDLDLKNSYTPGNAKVHSISMTDVALQVNICSYPTSAILTTCVSGSRVSILRYHSNTHTPPWY